MNYVYQIFTNQSLKTYIGSTSNVEKRFKQHLSSLKQGRHHSVHFQNFYNKHPDSIFYVKILAEFETVEDCKEYEELLLNINLNLFNVSKKSSGGDLISYHPDNKMIRQNMSKISKVLYQTNFNFKNYPKLGSLNPNYKGGKYIKRDVYCQVCNCLLKTVTATICTSCRAKTKVGSKNSFYGKQHTDSTKKKLSEIHSGKINQSCRKKVSVNNIEYDSLGIASKELGIHITTLSYRARSERFPEIFYIQEMPNDYRTPSSEESVE